MYRLFKYRQALLNGLALLVMAAGMIAGSVFNNTIVVTCLAALGTVIKNWNDFRNLSARWTCTNFPTLRMPRHWMNWEITYEACCLKRMGFGSRWKPLRTPSPTSHLPCRMIVHKSITVALATCQWKARVLLTDAFANRFWTRLTFPWGIKRPPSSCLTPLYVEKVNK